MRTSYPGQGCRVLMKIWILNMCCSVVMLPENGRLLCIWMIDDAPLKHILAAHIKYSAEFQHSQHHHCPEQWCTWPIINKYIQQCTVESWTAATIIIIRQLNRLMDSQQYDVMHCLSEKPHIFVSKLSICILSSSFSEFWKFRFSWDWDHFIFMRQHLTSHWETKILLSKYQGPRNSVK